MFRRDGSSGEDRALGEDEALRGLDFLEADVAINYSIPFDWGSLKVSDAAQEAYELTPLVAGVHKGDLPEGVGPSENRVDICVLSPSEIPDSPLDADNGLLFMHAGRITDGLRIDAGFRKNRSENIERFTEMFQQFTDSTEEDLDEIVDGEEGLSVTDLLERQTPQLMTHLLSEAVVTMVQQHYSDNLREEAEKKLIRGMTIKGAGGLAVGVAMLSLGRVDVANDVVAGIYPLGGMFLARKDLKKYLASTRLRQHLIETKSAVLAQNVGRDVHDTYCTANFDHLFEQRLEDS